MSNISPMTPAAQPSGRVMSVMDGQGQNAQNQWVRGKQVTYQLTTGQTGTVFIPDSDFNVDGVRAALAAAAQKLADVSNLTF
jgi:hypothetical protein